MTRQFVPFGGTWRLPVPVPYSLMVRDGDRAWSSGQAALGPTGDVLMAGDALAQAEIVAAHIDEALAGAALDRDDVSRLVLYCAVHDASTRQALKLYFAAEFPHRPLIEMVSVPHFSYAGLLLLVDVFCAPSSPMQEEDLPDGGNLRFVREEGVELLNISAPSNTIGRALGAAMSRHGLGPDRLLSGWGVCPEPALAAVPAQVAPRLPGFFSGALMPCFLGDDQVHLYLSFGMGKVSLVEDRADRVRLHLARTDNLAFLDARYLGARPADLIEQSHMVMDGLERMMSAHGLGFGDVVKTTTFFAGNDQPEALHGNLAVRNSYYTSPGPASTGVPIARMADPGSKLRVELVLKPGAGAVPADG